MGRRAKGVSAAAHHHSRPQGVGRGSIGVGTERERDDARGPKQPASPKSPAGASCCARGALRLEGGCVGAAHGGEGTATCCEEISR